MDPRLTFDSVAEIYERARPTYPSELFDAFFEVLPGQPKVLEIGPGTGQATAELLARGATLTAVELGPQFAERLRQRFVGNDHLSVVNDSFEEAPLTHHSFDAVTVATAYHWIDAQAQINRPVELLRPGGVLGIIDLIQVDSPVDQGYFDRVQPIYERYGGAKSAWMPASYDTAESTMVERLRVSQLYTDVEVVRVRWDQSYTAAGYRDLLWTHSGTQMMAEPDRTSMVDELVAVIVDEFDGILVRPLVATLTLATTR